MQQYISEQIHPGIIAIQALLRKIDRLRLPLASHRDVESILVRQVANEIDRVLPWQRGHGRRTAAISDLIGQAVGMNRGESHNLKLATLLHDIGLLMLPAHLAENKDCLEPESYVAIQNDLRLGVSLLEPFFFLREASILVAHYHERWDGSGYSYASENDSSPSGREFYRSPTPSMQFASPTSRTELREARSHLELSKSQPAPNLTRS